MQKLCYIGGLGLMSAPAARHLSGADSPARVLGVLDRGGAGARRARARADWKVHGAELTPELDSLLDFRPDVLAVCAGKNGDDIGLVAKSAAGLERRGLRSIILHMSTVSDAFVRAAREFCSAKQVDYVNYPLTGGPKGAELGGSHPNGMLILASGDPAVYARLEPTLLRLGRPRFFGERPEGGALVKLIGQHLVFNGCVGISSAAALFAERFAGGVIQGAEQTDFFDFLNGGAGGTRQWDVALKKGVSEGVWDEGFMVRHAAVDAVYAAAAAMSAELSRLAVEPMLNLAAAFSYLMKKYPSQELATHAVAREILAASAGGLNEYLVSVRSGAAPAAQLVAVVASFPPSVASSVLLDVRARNFTEAV